MARVTRPAPKPVKVSRTVRPKPKTKPTVVKLYNKKGKLTGYNIDGVNVYTSGPFKASKNLKASAQANRSAVKGRMAENVTNAAMVIAEGSEAGRTARTVSTNEAQVRSKQASQAEAEAKAQQVSQLSGIADIIKNSDISDTSKSTLIDSILTKWG